MPPLSCIRRTTEFLGVHRWRGLAHMGTPSCLESTDLDAFATKSLGYSWLLSLLSAGPATRQAVIVDLVGVVQDLCVQLLRA